MSTRVGASQTQATQKPSNTEKLPKAKTPLDKKISEVVRNADLPNQTKASTEPKVKVDRKRERSPDSPLAEPKETNNRITHIGGQAIGSFCTPADPYSGDTQIDITADLEGNPTHIDGRWIDWSGAGTDPYNAGDTVEVTHENGTTYIGGHEVTYENQGCSIM